MKKINSDIYKKGYTTDSMLDTYYIYNAGYAYMLYTLVMAQRLWNMQLQDMLLRKHKTLKLE